MFLRKNGAIEKNWNLFVPALPEKNKPPSRYPSDSLQNSTIIQPLPINFFRKNLTPATKRMGEAQITNHSVVLVWNRRTPNMVGDHARKFFIDYYLHSILAQLYWFSGGKTSRYDTVCIHIYMKFKNVIYLNYIYTYIYINIHTYI